MITGIKSYFESKIKITGIKQFENKILEIKIKVIIY